MAKSYTSSVQVKCWKQHTCAGCGAVYSYLLSRKAVGKARTADKARANMQKRIVAITKTETDMHPCPGCGLYQADMIGQRRAKSRMQFFIFALPALATVLILRAADLLQSQTCTFIAAGICILVVMANLLLELLNVNSDLAANQGKGQQQLNEGKLRYTAAATPAVNQSTELARPGRTLLHKLALLMLLGSVLAVLAPEAIRSARGWPLNSECYPPVVGPADQTRIYMPNSIRSIKGFWRGTPTVTLVYPGAVARSVDAVADQNDWGSTIYAKSEEQSDTSHPWVQITLPDSPELIGKTAQCDIDLKLEYPRMSGTSSFTTMRDKMQHSLDIRVGPRLSGSQYNSIWWAGTAGGTGLLLVGMLILYRQARASRQLAKPTEILAA